MTTVVDLRHETDPRDVVHRAVEVLANGGVADVPTEAEYAFVASVTSPEAVATCVWAAGVGDAAARRGLMFRSADHALDYVPRLGETGRKLLVRGPGSVVLLCPRESLEGGLGSSLDDRVRSAVVTGEGLACWLPGHEFVRHALELLPTPLLFAVPARAEESRTRSSGEREGVSLAVDAGPAQRGGAASWVRIGSDGDRETWSMVRPGVVDEDRIGRLAGRVFLFVCTGNTCRSPMAAALFRKMLAERLGCGVDDLAARGLFVESAGLSAEYGSPASPVGVTLLAERGIELGEHRSQPLTDAVADAADRVWTMTRSHLEMILQVRPDLAERCTTLCPDEDVTDPIGGDADDYAVCAKQIEECLERIVADLPPLA